jgi:hypothetical protein
MLALSAACLSAPIGGSNCNACANNVDRANTDGKRRRLTIHPLHASKPVHPMAPIGRTLATSSSSSMVYVLWISVSESGGDGGGGGGGVKPSEM